MIGASRVEGQCHAACCAIENSGKQIESLQSEIVGVARVANYMLLIVGTVIVLIAVAIIRRIRATSAAARTLGWMSEQWLAEHRASHLP